MSEENNTKPTVEEKREKKLKYHKDRYYRLKEEKAKNGELPKKRGPQIKYKTEGEKKKAHAEQNIKKYHKNKQDELMIKMERYFGMLDTKHKKELISNNMLIFLRNETDNF